MALPGNLRQLYNRDPPLGQKTLQLVQHFLHDRASALRNPTNDSKYTIGGYDRQRITSPSCQPIPLTLPSTLAENR